MSFHPAYRPFLVVGVLSAGLVWGSARSGFAQAIDPAVVGERLQRLTSMVESLELALASQKRQIEALGNEMQRLREDQLERAGQRPWADDLKRLADAVNEVDRKRVADSEQVVKVLNELRKAVATAAEPPKPASAARSGDAGGRREEGGTGSRGSGSAREPAVEKALPWVMERGQRLSTVVARFNEQAKKEGFQPLTVQQVMKFNNITDDRRIREGSTIQLPLIPR